MRERIAVGWQVLLLLLVLDLLDDAYRAAEAGAHSVGVVVDWCTVALFVELTEPFVVYYHHR